MIGGGAVLEQEIASMSGFVIKNTDNLQPYYENVPAEFMMPSVYFPTREIETEGNTLNSYTMTYIWYIKFFHRTSQGAYQNALKVLKAMKGNRNRIPLIDVDGIATGEFIRIHDPALSGGDEGVAQLVLRWDSRHLYTDETETQ